MSARGEVLAVRASFFDAVLVVLPCAETLSQDLHLMPVCSRPTNGSLAFIARAALHAPKRSPMDHKGLDRFLPPIRAICRRPNRSKERPWSSTCPESGEGRLNARSVEPWPAAPVTDCADCASGCPISAYYPSHIRAWSPSYWTMDLKRFSASSYLGDHYRSRALAVVRSACRVSAQTRKKPFSAVIIYDSDLPPIGHSARSCGGTARE